MEQEACLAILQEYKKVGAVKELSVLESQKVPFLVPWFIITKPEEGGGLKHRLISDCRLLNQHLQPQKFKLDHWKEIFQVLRKNMWACKIDLAHAYFHLPLSEKRKNYMNIQVGSRMFQFVAAPFGLSTLPQQWMAVMKVFLK